MVATGVVARERVWAQQVTAYVAPAGHHLRITVYPGASLLVTMTMEQRRSQVIGNEVDLLESTLHNEVFGRRTIA